MPFDCQHRQKHGPDICLTDCPSTAEHGGCEYARVERAGDLPPAEPDVIDVALLDMHHGWPNLGHDALVHAVQNAVCDLQTAWLPPDCGSACSPTTCGGATDPGAARGPSRHLRRHGRAGPPRSAMNDGRVARLAGHREDPRWEAPLFGLFDRIRADERRRAARGLPHLRRHVPLAGRRRGRPARRRTRAARARASSRTCSRTRPQSTRGSGGSRASCPISGACACSTTVSTTSSRGPARCRTASTIIAHETLGVGGPRGEALTMVEFARDADGVMPRDLRREPPSRDREPAQAADDPAQALERGEVTPEWYAERVAALTEDIRRPRRSRAAPHLQLHAAGAAALLPLSRGAGAAPRASAAPSSSTPIALPILFRASADQLQADD